MEPQGLLFFGSRFFQQSNRCGVGFLAEKCLESESKAVQDLLFDLAQKRKSDFVFPSSRKPGERLGDSKVGFWRAVKLAGIPHIRVNDLRHTFASRLVRAGADLITVQHLLGHANITMTARYAHALEDGKIDAVRRLGGRKSQSS